MTRPELADTDPADLCGVHTLPAENRKPVVDHVLPAENRRPEPDHVLEALAHLGAALMQVLPEDRDDLTKRIWIEHMEAAKAELEMARRNG